MNSSVVKGKVSVQGPRTEKSAGNKNARVCYFLFLKLLFHLKQEEESEKKEKGKKEGNG